MSNEELHKKYHLELTVEQFPRKLSSWRNHAWKQIERFIDDEEFSDYFANVYFCKDENKPGPFTCFLYWFGQSCEAGWGVMVDFNEYTQRLFLCDHYYKWMHKIRDEVLAYRETQEANAQNPSL